MRRNLIAITFLLVLPVTGCNNGGRNEIIIFHAGSLAVPISRLVKQYEADNPGVKILTEAAGSLVCARKITELNKPCDIMASADYQIIDDMLIPEYADWNLGFATNEIVIAYTAKSRHAEVINEHNWSELLAGSDVIYGRSDPDSDPCGYRTLMMLSLAEEYYGVPGLREKFEAKDRSYIRPKEIDLTALLQAGAVDYIFQYRSVAVQHQLKYVKLSPEINLGDPLFAESYRSVSQQVAGSKPGETVLIKGDFIMYGITLLKNAPNRQEAEKFLAFLLSPEGRSIFSETGQNTISPPILSGVENPSQVIMEATTRQGL
ncbi:MAG: extracellular solute-binding protein [Bacteroidales bacterium]|jgi:molybdate/tungstate transport system substrate-binding protein|nr:extracellular solute-binding protein [Bacteroidales bacterium]